MMTDSQKKFSLLLVDDETSAISALLRVFRKEDYQLHCAESGEVAQKLLSRLRIDAALIDLKMPGMGGMALLEKIKKQHPEVMTLILTAHGGVEEAVYAMQLGAFDFLEKPFSPERLRERISQLHQVWILKQQNRTLHEGLEGRFHYDQLVGNSTPMLELKQLIVQVSAGNASVLIQGESGTGKELVARAIHHQSPRRSGPFVPVDCASLNETVIESELFGHTKGAYTGAHAARPGLIRSADQGTLFLDEIGELTLAMQAKLLRTIQEREVRPVGSSQSHSVNIRILAASNRDLTAEVERGNFREDLFYRLNTVVIQVKPLRERGEDIPLFAKLFVKRFHSEVSPVREISREALTCLLNYHWPGNIRELENVILRAVALGKNEQISPEDLPPAIHCRPGINSMDRTSLPDDSLEACEKAAILNVLNKCHDNRRLAAELLGIGEATLYRKLKKYHLS